MSRIVKAGKPVYRESAVQVGGTPIIVGVGPKVIIVRRKGSTVSFEVPISSIWQQCIQHAETVMKRAAFQAGRKVV